MKYDWRNLLIENKNTLSQFTFKTMYRYDEAGNRVNKQQYMYVLGEPPIGGGTDSIIVDEGDGQGYWAMAENIFYVRDVSGKEIAIYSGSSLQQWNIWGLDNVGKINSDTTKYYYLKDHLGSTRAVINSTNTVVSAQDYDCWGYLLENRSYQPENTKYKFTGKERDNELENNYDYFGARYYDSRIGRWGGVEPLYNRYLQITPYNYALNNPIKLYDENGKGPRSDRPMASPYEGAGGGPVGVGVGVVSAMVALIEATKGIGTFMQPIVEAIVTGKIGNLFEEWLGNLWNAENTSEGENVSQDNTSEGESQKIDENTDLTDPKTWPKPPTEKVYGKESPVKEGAPSRVKPKNRGEKSYWDEQGGEWRPLKPDKYHPEGTWRFKPRATPENKFPEWQNVKP